MVAFKTIRYVSDPFPHLEVAGIGFENVRFSELCVRNEADSDLERENRIRVSFDGSVDAV